MLCIVKKLFFIFLLLFPYSINANNIDYTNFDNIMKSYQDLRNGNVKIENKEKIYIFISFSMSDNLIKEYLKESIILKEKENLDIIFVIRGFKNNSFKETISKIQILSENKEQYSIIVDPTLFKKYDIKYAPVFVKQYLNENFMKISGSITLRYVVEKFKEVENESF